MRVLIACEYSGIVRDAFLEKGHDAMSCDLLPTESPGPHFQGDVRDILDGWKPVVFAFDMLECDCCEEPFCPEHNMHYWECHCYGPTQDDLEYEEINGVLMARPIDSPHWDLMIAHPDCTYLTCSAEWAYKDGPYHQKVKPETLVGESRRIAREEALSFVDTLFKAPIKRKAIENPRGVISTRIRKASQYIQPYEYGDDASKITGLWLDGLPLLRPTQKVPGRIVEWPKGSGKMVERWGNQTDSGQNKLTPGPNRWKERAKTYQGIANAFAEQWSFSPTQKGLF